MSSPEESAPPNDSVDLSPSPMSPSLLSPLPTGGIASRSFLALLATQFLGAVNDNMFRWFVIGVAKGYVPEGDSTTGPLILSAGLFCFVLPYLLLAAPAGYLADRFSKRKVIIGCKLAEVAIMIVGIAAVSISGHFENFYILLVIVFVMGSQSALFGPAKLGSVPEMIPAEKISVANGVLGLTTVVATTVGFGAGNYLAVIAGDKGLENGKLWIAAIALIGLAVIGVITSLGISRLRAANSKIRFPWNAASQTLRDLRTLGESRAMLRVALGMAFFWAIGSLCQLNIDQFGLEGELEQHQITPLLSALIIGVGLGSVLAGIWSGGKVELGILPLGAAGIAISALLLFTVRGDLMTPQDHWTAMHIWACVWLFTLGISAGLFDVPLASYMQHHSPANKRGAILAANNFITFGGMLLVSILFAYIKPKCSAREIFLAAGICTVPVFIYIVWLLPQASIRFFVWLASHTIYRVKVFGRENLPETGGALLVANHVSWLDGVFLLMTSSRPVRMIAYAPYVQSWWSRWICRAMHVIPIAEGPKSIRHALDTARKAVEAGELVCIFPEGRITRSGELQAFKPGFLRIVEGTGTTVVPVFIDELWGSIFSYRDGRAFWKWPRKWPYPVSIHFGQPIPAPDELKPVRDAVETLGVNAAMQRKTESMNLPKAFLQTCRRMSSQSKIADTSGADLTGRDLLLRTLIFRRLLLRNVLEEGETHVGLLLPPSAAAAVANAALPLCGRIAVNLNYTVSSDVMNHCISQSGIRHVLTSRKFMEKLNERGELQIDAPLIYLEDFKEEVTLGDKLAGALGAYVTPIGMLAKQLGVATCDPDQVFTIIFTSGSTGEPKGVQLTLRNVSSNAAAMDQLVGLTPSDVVVGILPFFHSFGFTITLWTALSLDIKGIYHFNPLDARPIGKLCQKHKATILLSTPTFLRSLLRRCEVEEMKTIDVVVTGAEKLPAELADAFEKKFGVRPVEGYGTTELSPLAAVNLPPSRASAESHQGLKEGTVGLPVPGTKAKIVHIETGEELGQDTSGMLLISGPNVMKGYLNKPELTAEVIRDGWYVTGDIAKIDEDGFIQITGRESRFSKIGGEMVPHVRIEEELGRLLAEADSDDDRLLAVVSAVPHPKKGERVVVLHLNIDRTPEELCQGLAAAGLPALWIPSLDSFYEVDDFPILGTGKIDLKAIKQLALEKTGS